MPITSDNILAHEWIGLKVAIKRSMDPGVRDLSGTVRDETRNTFSIESGRRTIQIAKSGTVFITTLPTGERVTVDGDRLRYRPEDRVKKGLAKW